MKHNARETLDAYYREAGSWAEDRRVSLISSRRVAWIMAGVAATIALLEAIALLVLMPLKTVVPYTLLVDKQTGFVQALKPLEAQLVSGNTALTQSFLVQYVIARESFDLATLQTNYRKVSLWSQGSARSAYIAKVQASNPESFLAQLPRDAVVETQVKSVSPLGQNAALVRFETVRSDASGAKEGPRLWVAIVKYRFSGEPLSLEDRFINPLGFEVTHYQRSAEALPAVATPVEQPSTSPSATAPANSGPLQILSPNAVRR